MSPHQSALRRAHLAAVLLPLLSAAAHAGAAAEPVFTPEAFRAHVAFLADDLLEGRETGSRGHEIGARYVAAQMQAFGLKPGGETSGWYQRVTFQQTSQGATPGSVTIAGPAGDRLWMHGVDAMVGLSSTEPSLDFSAPLIFVGYGIENKLLGLDDYRGLDVRGKIVVILRGYPKGMPSEEGAHVSRMRATVAEQHGAIGLISIDTLQSARTTPWQIVQQFANRPDFDWVGTDGKPFVEAPGIRAAARLGQQAAETLFAGSGHDLQAVLREADREGGRPRGFALKTSARIRTSSVSERVTSPNVVGILPGADPRLAGEYVVLSAHLDHLGLSAPDPKKPDADRINNGALDNASGVATMLEVARTLASSPNRPRRSVIFLATTGEEHGKLGAQYYARHPTVPIGRIVGNVDLDMPVLLYPFTDVVAFGANHSTLGAIVAQAVAPMNLQLAPDPMPEQGLFTRSDHYEFVTQGVPAVFLATGFANGGAAQWEQFLVGAYHHPDDDLNQPIDWQSGARFAEANYRITRAMADGDDPPLWLQGDFFGDTFAPGARRAPAPKATKGSAPR